MSDEPHNTSENQAEENDDQLAAELEAVDEAVAGGGGAITPPQSSQLAGAREMFELINRVRQERIDRDARDTSGSNFQLDEMIQPPARDASRSPSGARLDDTQDTGDLNRDLAARFKSPTITQIGQYQIVSEIARGGMGVVFRARHLELDRDVALKMMIAGPFAREQEKQRFRVEGEAAAQLDHPNIVPMYDVGEHCGQPYFTMGFIEGKTLSAEIDQEPMEPTVAAEMCKQIAEAVDYAHGKGVVHRDIKPLNILVDQDGRPRITDFGLARRLDSDSDLTGTGQVLGTPNFMAPEQAAGKTDQIGKLSDVYSIGATLYCALTGRPPFQAANAIDTLRSVIEQDPVSPRDLNPSLPVDVATICLKCLHKDQRARYASAADLAADLQRFLDHEPIRARPVGTLERALKWSRRRPAIAGLLMTVAASLLALVIGGLWYQFRLSEALAESETRGDANARLLYDSSIREATFLNQVRPPGYTARVWEALGQVRHLDTPEKDLERIRQLGISALGHYAAEEPDLFSDIGSHVRSADVTTDDRYLIAGLEDGRILILDRQTNQTRQELQVADGPIAGVQMVDPDTFFAYTDFCRRLSWWQRSADDTWSQTKEMRFDDQEDFFPVKPTPDGSTVIGYYLLGKDQIKEAEWNWHTQKPRYVTNTGDAAIRFCTRRVPRFASTEEVSPADLRTLDQAFASSYFAISRGHLVTLVREDSYGISLKVVNLLSGEIERLIPTDSGGPGDVIISADGRYIGYGGHQGAEVFDRESGERISKLAYEGSCWPIAFVGSQGDLFYTDDDHYILYSSQENRELARYAKDLSVGAMKVASSGRQLLWLGLDSTQVVDLVGRQRVEFDFGTPAAEPSFSADGRLLIVNVDADQAFLIDTQNRSEVTRIAGLSATISPSGEFLMTWSDGRLLFWNVADGTLAGETDCEDRPRPAKFHPSGKWFAIAHRGRFDVLKFDASQVSDDGDSTAQVTATKIWSTESWAHADLVWSPKSPILAYHKSDDAENVIQIKDFRESEDPYDLAPADPGSPQKIAFIDDKRLVLLNQFHLKSWDLDTRESKDFTGKINYPIYLSPDRRFVMGGSRIHQISDLQQFVDLPTINNHVWNSVWSPDQRLVAWGHANGKVTLWNLEAIGQRLSDLDLQFPVDRFQSLPTQQPIAELIELCRLLPDREVADRWKERYEQALAIASSQAAPPTDLDRRVRWLINHLPTGESRPFHRQGQGRAHATRQLNLLIVDLSRHASNDAYIEWLKALVQANIAAESPILASAQAYSLHTLADAYQFRSEHKMDKAVESYQKSVELVQSLKSSGHLHLLPDYQLFWNYRNYSEALRNNGDRNAAIEFLKRATEVGHQATAGVSKENQRAVFQRLVDWLVEAEQFDEARQFLEHARELGHKLDPSVTLIASSEWEVARWLLERQARLTVRTEEGVVKRCDELKDLPDAVEGITKIEFYHLQPEDMPTAKELLVLQNLKSLHNLHLGRNPSSSGELAELLKMLVGIDSLTHLFLSNTALTLNSLNILEGSSLQEVTINGTPAANDGRLTAVRQRLTPIFLVTTDAEAAAFSMLRGNSQSSLVIQTIDGNRRTVTTIGELPHTGFQLIDCKPDVTRPIDGYSFSSRLPQTRSLERLDLSNRKDISDESVPILAKYVHLKRLDLGGTAITQTGISKLRDAIPNCEIVFKAPVVTD